MPQMLTGEPGGNVASNFEFRNRAFPTKIEIEAEHTQILDSERRPIGSIEFYSSDDGTNILMVVNVPENSKDIITTADIHAMRDSMENSASEIKNRYPRARLHLFECFMTPVVDIKLDTLSSLFAFQSQYFRGGVTIPVFGEHAKLTGMIGSVARILNTGFFRGIKAGQDELALRLAKLDKSSAPAEQ